MAVGDVRNRFFLFRLGFGLVFEKKTWLQFRMSLIRFGLKNVVRSGYCSYLLLR